MAIRVLRGVRRGRCAATASLIRADSVSAFTRIIGHVPEISLDGSRWR